jgi:hypothetical protein
VANFQEWSFTKNLKHGAVYGQSESVDDVMDVIMAIN